MGMMKYVKTILALDPLPQHYKEELKERLADPRTGNGWLSMLSNPKFKEIIDHTADQLDRIAADLKWYYVSLVKGEGGDELAAMLGPPENEEVLRQDDPRCGMPSPPSLSKNNEVAFKLYIQDLYLILANHANLEYSKDMHAMFGDATAANQEDGCFTGCAVKRYERCAGKFRSKDDHATRADPKGACNIDGVRGCAVFSDAAFLVDAVKQVQAKVTVGQSWEGRMKNQFHSDADGSQTREYRALLMNSVMQLDMTWGEIADEMVEQNGCPATESARKWMEEEGYSTLPVRMVVEVQFTVDFYLKSRKRSHLPYQLFRSYDARNLADGESRLILHSI
jgi:hypothetical protein